MTAAVKKSEKPVPSSPARRKAVIAVEQNPIEVAPVVSPARKLQARLARRLDEPQSSTSEVLLGLFVGICGAAWVTGILIYATM